MNFLNKIQEKKWAILHIILICVLLFGKTISYDYSLDDQFINTNIPGKEDGINGLLSVFEMRFNKSDYRPILILSYALEKYLTGEENPHLSHAVNLIFYILLCISIYYFMLLLPLGKESKLIAFAVALFFAVHPIHANVVGNLKSRDNILSMLFGILTTIQILKAMSIRNSVSIFRYLFASFLFVLAISSKMDAIGFVFFIPLVIIIFFNSKKPIYLFGIVLICIALQSLFHNFIPNKIAPVDLHETTRVTFTENPFTNNFSLLNKMGAASMTGFYYLKFMIIPYGYWYYFGFDQVKLFPINSFPAILSFIFLAVIFIYGVWNFRKDKLLSLGILSVFIFLAYCFNFFLPVAGIIADRYAFISSLGFCMAAIALINRFSNNNASIKWKTGIAVVIIWSIFSFTRVSVWKDGLTMIENDAPHLENSYEGQRIAAMTYVAQYEKNHEKELLEKALLHIKKANSIYPENSVCHTFEGLIYYKKGQLNEAEKHYQIALKNDTTSSEVLELIGDLKYEQNKLSAARKAYDALWKLNPENNAVINKISTVIYESNGADSVVKYNNMLIQTNASLFAPYENLGYLYLLQKDTVKAKKYFERAIKKGMNPLGVPDFLR